jgi:hypothetical protein
VNKLYQDITEKLGLLDKLAGSVASTGFEAAVRAGFPDFEVENLLYYYNKTLVAPLTDMQTVTTSAYKAITGNLTYMERLRFAQEYDQETRPSSKIRRLFKGESMAEQKKYIAEITTKLEERIPAVGADSEAGKKLSDTIQSFQTIAAQMREAEPQLDTSDTKSVMGKFLTEIRTFERAQGLDPLDKSHKKPTKSNHR